MACCCELQDALDVDVTQESLLDVEIGGSAGVLLQAKSVDITDNGTSVVAPDDGCGGWKSVELNTTTPKNITGVIGVPDGMSIAQLLCSTSAASSVTEIVDTNVGWTMDKAISGFPNLEKVILKCKRWEESANRLNPMMRNLIKVKEVIADELEYIPDDAIANRTNASLLDGLTACESVSFKSLKRAIMVYPTGGKDARLFKNMPSLKVVYFDGMEYINVYRTDNYGVKFASADSLENIYLGNLNKNKQAINLDNQTHLVLISIKGCEGSFNLMTWNPTNALSERLPEFLSNFRDYIAERLTDNGKGLTLTLSQEVRNAIHAAEDEYGIENIIITKKGWTISPAPN